jgi:dihydrodipicolinate synthase/N-acetylneuraminate lyase
MIRSLSPSVDPATLVRPRRAIQGVSAVLLPCTATGAVDWDGFAAHVARTAACGIVPGINMDTGYCNLIDDSVREQALRIAREVVGPAGALVAGAYVADAAGAAFDEPGYLRQCEMIAAFNGLPVIFPSFGLTSGSDADFVARHAALARRVGRFLGFELTPELLPQGRVLSLDAYADLLGIPECVGAKHSSFRRGPEWDRLAVRDRLRPDFQVFTGNDRAIDMVRYGSDWLLGLSTAWPEAFARRDAWWAAGDRRFDELDDALQSLGDFTFRPPAPAYKHSMAQVLRLRGLLESDEPHPRAWRRPESDLPILAGILAQIQIACDA